jgi:hypothetical protein
MVSLAVVSIQTSLGPLPQNALTVLEDGPVRLDQCDPSKRYSLLEEPAVQMSLLLLPQIP